MRLERERAKQEKLDQERIAREKERVEREKARREKLEREEAIRIRACQKAQGISENAGRELVGKFGGGRDIVVNLKSCEYNSYDKNIKTKIEIYWNGAIFRSNNYNIDGVLSFNENGSNLQFSQTYASEGVKNLQFYNTMLSGVVALGSASRGSSGASTTKGVPIHVNNKCIKSIRIAIHYLAADTDKWITEYWWSVGPNDGVRLSMDSKLLRTNNTIIYYYAEIKGAPQYKWSGPTTGEDSFSARIEGKNYSFRKLRDTNNSKTTITLNCNNYSE